MAKQLQFELRRVAQAHGFHSADDLARASNVKFTTVTRYWYSKVKNPSAPILMKLAHAMGLTVEDLFIEEETPEP